MTCNAREPQSVWDGTPWKIREARRAYQKVPTLEPLSTSPLCQSTPIPWLSHLSPHSTLRTPATGSASPLEWHSSDSSSDLSLEATSSTFKDPSLRTPSYLRHTLTLDNTSSNPWVYHEAPAPHVLRYVRDKDSVDYTPLAPTKHYPVYRNGGDPPWRHLMFAGLSAKNTKVHHTFARLLVWAHQSWPQRELVWLANDLIQTSINKHYTTHSAAIISFIGAIGRCFKERFGAGEVSGSLFANALAEAALQTFRAFWDVTTDSTETVDAHTVEDRDHIPRALNMAMFLADLHQAGCIGLATLSWAIFSGLCFHINSIHHLLALRYLIMRSDLHQWEDAPMGNTLLIYVARAVGSPLLDYTPGELKPDRKLIYTEIREAFDDVFMGQYWCPLPENGPWMMEPMAQPGGDAALERFYPCCMISR
ncbi:hypothetical protein BKA70DRAFT_1530501 [Coprinopsis sp. MPI-PUGE-AT-0042]|nr:hypothetical protein BKA70DRAFT_1530501 [Coprinopsis sp. MPI-PUGE-AT-0042]